MARPVNKYARPRIMTDLQQQALLWFRDNAQTGVKFGDIPFRHSLVQMLKLRGYVASTATKKPGNKYVSMGLWYMTTAGAIALKAHLEIESLLMPDDITEPHAAL